MITEINKIDFDSFKSGSMVNEITDYPFGIEYCDNISGDEYEWYKTEKERDEVYKQELSYINLSNDK